MKILVCTDGSPYAEKAVKAAGIAANYFGFEVTILSVIEDVVTYDKFPEEPGFVIRKELAEETLKKAEDIIKGVNPDLKCNTRLAHGNVSSQIVKIAEHGEYDGIFIGTKGMRGIKRMLLGSVADEVIRHAHCPVTLVR